MIPRPSLTWRCTQCDWRHTTGQRSCTHGNEDFSRCPQCGSPATCHRTNVLDATRDVLAGRADPSIFSTLDPVRDVLPAAALLGAGALALHKLFGKSGD